MRRIDFLGFVLLSGVLSAAVAHTVTRAQAEPQLTDRQRAAIELVKVCGGDLTIDMLSAQAASITLITCSVSLPKQDPQPTYKPAWTLIHHE